MTFLTGVRDLCPIRHLPTTPTLQPSEPDIITTGLKMGSIIYMYGIVFTTLFFLVTEDSISWSVTLLEKLAY